jgi:hypothetical protein
VADLLDSTTSLEEPTQELAGHDEPIYLSGLFLPPSPTQLQSPKEIYQGKGCHRRMNRKAVIKKVEKDLKDQCQVHDMFPKDEVQAIALITKSMRRIIPRVSRDNFEVGMTVEFVVVEPTSNGTLEDENDMQVRTAFGTFL